MHRCTSLYLYIQGYTLCEETAVRKDTALQEQNQRWAETRLYILVNTMNMHSLYMHILVYTMSDSQC